MLKDAFINRFNVDESNFVQNYAAIVTKKGDKKEDTINWFKSQGQISDSSY